MGASFLYSLRPALGPTQPTVNGCRVFFPEVERLRRGVDQPIPCSAEVKERVELYLYPPSGAFMACGRLKFSCNLVFYSNVTRAMCQHIHLWYLVSVPGKFNRKRFENHARTLTTFYGRNAGI